MADNKEAAGAPGSAEDTPERKAIRTLGEALNESLVKISQAEQSQLVTMMGVVAILASLPETQSEALATLDKLARKDLVTSAAGYATLAKLRKASGDDLGHEAAMKKYEALAKKGKPATPAAPAADKGKGSVFST